MAHFVFGAFKVVEKSTRSRTTTNYETLEKDVRGIVIKDENNTIRVKVEDKSYPITDDSYDCKGKKEVWLQNYRDKYGHRIRIIRRECEDRVAMDSRYAPFAVGLPCWGDIIKKPLESPKFKIKKCINPNIY